MCFSTQRREFKYSAFTNMRRSLKRSVKVSNKGKNIAVTLGHQLLSCHSNSMFRQDTKVRCELEYKKVGRKSKFSFFFMPHHVVSWYFLTSVSFYK